MAGNTTGQAEAQATVNDLASPEHRRLVNQVLDIVLKDPETWTRGECMLLVSLCPAHKRNAAIHLLWEAWHLHFDAVELRIRMHLAAEVDWAVLLNPVVRKTSWFNMRAHKAELGWAKDVRKLMSKT